MCGIWGIIKKQRNKGFDNMDLGLMRDMAIAGAQRGEHGTGIVGMSLDKPPVTLKAGGNPYWLLYDKTFNKDVIPYLKEDGIALFGHNRYATRGAVSTPNAHPFQTDHITLVHNGTIRNGLAVPKDEVDSRVLTAELARKGVSVFEEISGAWTTVWHDAEKNTVNILRNGERPLSVMQNYGYIFFASDDLMLTWLLKTLLCLLV